MSSSFFVTLPSHANGVEFPDNEASSFTIRLPYPLRLSESGWKVRLSSISMPDSRLNLAKLTNNVVNDVVMVMDFVFKTAHGEELQSNAYVYGRSLQNDNSIVDGIHFLHAVAKRIDRERVLHGKKGTTLLGPSYEREYITFQWVTKAEETQLLIDNSQNDARDAAFSPILRISVFLAINMGWLRFDDSQPSGQEYQLGPNLVMEHFYDTIPDPKDIDSKTFFKVENQMVQLSTYCNWRFINLNSAFESIVGSPTRTLQVYSDVGGSSIVGNQVTDLLREVKYKNEGKGTVYFEPLHIQYLPLRNEYIEMIETQVADTDGNLVNFGPENTIPEIWSELHQTDRERRRISLRNPGTHSHSRQW